MDLYALSRAYPIVTLVVAVILFVIGFKVAKILLWILAVLALIAAAILFFV
jgi:hypothetical protein